MVQRMIAAATAAMARGDSINRRKLPRAPIYSPATGTAKNRAAFAFQASATRPCSKACTARCVPHPGQS